MIVTDYYEFIHSPECKAKTRLDCVASTQNYNEFEMTRNKHGQLFIYFCDVPDKFKADIRRKADKSITSSKGKNISSVFVPVVVSPFAYGDIAGTADAILLINNPDYTQIEIFVARGQKNNRINLYQMLSDGELDDEISSLRKAAVTELVTDKND